MSLDLGTGASQALDSVGSGTCLKRITRSGDRTRALAVNCGGLGTVAIYSILYESATHGHTLSGYWISYTPLANNAFTSASASGHVLFQFGHTVMDSSVATLAATTEGADVTYGAAIAPNATDFYVSQGSSDSQPGLYLRYALPRQVPSEFAIIPHPAYELAVSPDAATLIGITADTISAIDLTHSTPASPAQIARVRRLLRSSAPKTRVAAAALEKPDAFTVRLGGRALRPIAFSRASQGSSAAARGARALP
jgi:hypothetical protein